MSGVPEHLCGYPWENCWATATHTYQSVTTTKVGDFTYVTELCNEHLREQLAALTAQFEADSCLNHTVSITPIHVSQIGTPTGNGK